ncbi:uncharacterized protein DS421_2g41020 [Arachis hypogaea]|nr:uncharacterized protein DS421_2g41020 [Arachis hypogaea]
MYCSRKSPKTRRHQISLHNIKVQFRAASDLELVNNLGKEGGGGRINHDSKNPKSWIFGTNELYLLIAVLSRSVYQNQQFEPTPHPSLNLLTTRHLLV